MLLSCILFLVECFSVPLDSLCVFMCQRYHLLPWMPPSLSLGSNNYTESAHFLPTLTNLYVDNLACVGETSSAACTSVVAALAMPARAVALYGAPATAFVTLSGTDNGQSIDIELIYLEKTPTMLGESIMFTFNPAPVCASLI